MRGGQIVFDVDPRSPQQPTCLRRIEVTAEGESEASWLESVSYDDDCANEFPLEYGRRLRGRHQQDTPEVAAKPLRHETIYVIIATSGATGYGGGRFIVHTDGKVENLPPQPLASGTTSVR